MPSRLLGILCLSLLLASGCNCSDSDRAELSRVIATRTRALNSKDLTLYLTVVSRSFSDKGNDFDRLKERLERSFKDFERISYESENPRITVGGQQAEAVGRYHMRCRLRGRDTEFDGTEHLRFVKEPDGWKIVAGI